jgi:hypothetical protein
MATPPPPQPPSPSAAPAIQTSASAPPVLTDGQSAKLAKQAEDVETFYRDQLLETWQTAVRHQKLYLGSKRDTRKEHEKWRAAIRIPRPFMMIEAKTAQGVEIITGADPMIQATAVGEDDRERAKAAEKQLDAVCYANQFRKLLTATFRAMSVAGTDWWTSRYGKKSFTVNVQPTTEDLDYFNKSVEDAMGRGIIPPPDWQTAPDEFEMWRADVNITGKGRIPEPPKAGPREIVTHEGPIIERVPYFEMRYDPLVQEVRDQPYVIRRMVRSSRWVKRLVEKGLFDEARVARAMSGWDGQKVNEYEQEVAALLGYSTGSTQDPNYENAVEVWIVYAQENREFPYQVILNRKEVVNTRPDQLPYSHGGCEYIALRNILIPGYQAGMSDLKQPEGLFTEVETLRNMRLDAVTLSVLPVMVKSPEMGLTELQRHIAPGAVLNARNSQSIKKLIDSIVPNVAFTEMDSLYNEIDEVTGINGLVRGAQAAVNRVSASEATGRFQQALLRPKLNAAMLEEDLNPMVIHWLSHLYQFGKPELRVRMTGMPGDPLVTLRKQDLLDAFRWDMRFVGATRAQDRAMMAQQLIAFIEKFGAQMMPVEIRAAMKDAFEAVGMKGVNEVITEAGTQKLQAAWEMQMNAALAAQQQQQAAGQAQAMGAPAVVEGAQADAVAQAGGGPPQA